MGSCTVLCTLVRLYPFTTYQELVKLGYNLAAALNCFSSAHIYEFGPCNVIKISVDNGLRSADRYKSQPIDVQCIQVVDCELVAMREGVMEGLDSDCL